MTALEAHPRREARADRPAGRSASLGNLAAYALWVYPLGVKSAGAADRAAAATRSLQAAERELAAAARAGRRQGARRAGAARPSSTRCCRPICRRRATDLRDAAGAGEEDQRQDARSPLRSRPRPEKNARLGLLKVHTAWQGDYESFRQFIYALESASPFVIIDDVSLAQNDPTKPLTLTMELSTYYRLGANGN